MEKGLKKTKHGKRLGGNAEKPISLKPLEFDEAVSGLLKVKPQGKSRREGGQDGKSKAAPQNNTT
jgi:hypothetical protein